MAIDTAEKRKNVSSIGLVFMVPGVTPNASPDAEWRVESGFSYSGITPSGVVATPTRGTGVWLRRRRRSRC